MSKSNRAVFGLFCVLVALAAAYVVFIGFPESNLEAGLHLGGFGFFAFLVCGLFSSKTAPTMNFLGRLAEVVILLAGTAIIACGIPLLSAVLVFGDPAVFTGIGLGLLIVLGTVVQSMSQDTFF